MELNLYNLYSMNGGNADAVDDVDQMIRNLETVKEYENVKQFIVDNFGEFEGWEAFEYPELDKTIAISQEKDKVTFCVAKDNKQYFGKYWQFVSKESEEK